MKQGLMPLGTLTIPREFVLMNRAAIGLGAVFLHPKAELIFHQLFEAEIEGFEGQSLEERQRRALTDAGFREEKMTAAGCAQSAAQGGDGSFIAARSADRWP